MHVTCIRDYIACTCMSRKPHPTPCIQPKIHATCHKIVTVTCKGVLNMLSHLFEVGLMLRNKIKPTLYFFPQFACLMHLESYAMISKSDGRL